jgi:hypothetical protein
MSEYEFSKSNKNSQLFQIQVDKENTEDIEEFWIKFTETNKNCRLI